MNILHAVLSLDIDELRDNEFAKVTLSLINNEEEKEIIVIKNEDDFRVNVIYIIDGEKYDVNLPMGDAPSYVRRRYFDKYEKLKDNINKYIKLLNMRGKEKGGIFIERECYRQPIFILMNC